LPCKRCSATFARARSMWSWSTKSTA
jgi:hypothetical protein